MNLRVLKCSVCGCGGLGGKVEKLECTRRSPKFLFLLRAEITLCVCSGGYDCCVVVKFCLNLWCSGWRVCENVVIRGSSVVVVEKLVGCVVWERMEEGGDRGERGGEGDVWALPRSTPVPAPERGP